MTTLPIEPTTFWLGTAALGLIASVALIYLLLHRVGDSYQAPVWERLSAGWLAILVPLAVLWVGLFLLTVALAFTDLWRTIPPGGGAPASLGLGALLAALLGAPFVIWGTVLKYQTVSFQKEGHITDRINKAVEQLGAEKDISRVMRNVRYTLDGQEHAELEGKDERLSLPAKATDVTRGNWEVVKRTVPNIEVRIGAILSLERIAQDSTRYDRGRDHVRVMEILCAYVRENAPVSSAQDHPFGEWEPLKDDPTEEERAAHLAKYEERFGNFFTQGQVYQWARTVPAPRADIAIALRVIGRRTPDQRLAEARWGKDAGPGDAWVFDTPCPSLPDDTTAEIRADFATRLGQWQETIGSYRGYRLDLRNTNLQGADLSDLALSGARLDGARMEGANLRGARMEGADLLGARMEGANLGGARMVGADLWGARMEGANLGSARMEGADLWGARMEGANLGDARMEGADLRRAKFDASTYWDRAVLGGGVSPIC